MDWSAVAKLSAVADVKELIAQLRVMPALAGLPELLDVKVYRNRVGRYEAVLSRMPVTPPKPGAPRTVMTRPPSKVATRVQPETFSSPEAAVDHALRSALFLAERLKTKTWDPNPAY